MKDEYIKQAKKELAFAGKKKADILSDLRETFSAGLEHGETEQDIVNRLGSPAEFARDIYEELNIDAAARKKRRFKIQALISFLVFAVFAAVGFILSHSGVPEGVIGQADAMTCIWVEENGTGIQTLLMTAGAAALIVFVISIVRCAKSSK